MSASAIIESTRGMVSFYEPLTALASQESVWKTLERYCANLEQYPAVMSALSRLYANSMMDFEKGLFCGLICALVAEKLDLSEERARALYYAALTQDVGHYMEDFRVAEYFAPNDAESGKSSYLSSAYDRSRSHALVSYSLLEEAIPDDVLVAELVLHHHAKEDGTGYPRNVGESQLNVEMQALIVANQLCDLVQARGGFDELFRCRAALKLASTMHFKRVNGAYHELLQDAAERLGYQSIAAVNPERVREHVMMLSEFSDKATSLSDSLEAFEHSNSVRLLRSRIHKVESLVSQPGIWGALPETCESEVALYLEALPEYLEPIHSLLKDVLPVLTHDIKEQAVELKSVLMQFLSLLKRQGSFSLFS